jgi:hypothetical protein
MSTSVNISKRIKITIPDDPIFSGIYVFDRGLGDYSLNSANWIFNTGLSQYNLNTYNHPYINSYGTNMNGKLLVSLNDTGYDSANPDAALPGYNELKTSLYKGENDSLANQLEDVFSFPAKFVFTAVQPPCPCSGEIGTSWPPVSTTQASGHRLAVGFAPPIRWRQPYSDWIIVDRISHTISGIPNYATGVVFNNGLTYFSTTDQAEVTLNNSKSIKYTESSVSDYQYEEGMAMTRDGYLGITAGDSGFWPVCTGLTDLGFSFRVSASGLGIAKDGRAEHYASWDDNITHIQGIGPFQVYETYYTWNDADSAPTTLVDERPFFGPKIPVMATIEFVDSCRPGRPCVNLTPDTVSPVQVSGICFSKSNIISNLFCGNIQANPSQSSLDSYGVSSISIVYSGVSTAYPAIKEPLGNYYDVYKTNINSPIIKLLHESPMPYTGIMDLINNRLSVVEHGIAEEDPATYKNFLQYSDIELVWNVDAPNQKATVYIIPDLDAPYNNTSILVCGSDISQVNGKYSWNNLNKIFNHYSSPNFHIIGQNLGISAKWILGSGNFDINNNSMWNPNSMDPLEWKTYYTLNNNVFSEISQSWSIGQNNIGTNPPPSSVAYCTIPRTCDPINIPLIEALYVQLNNGETTVSYDNGSTWQDLPGNPASLSPTDTFYINNDFAILGDTFMTQGSCKWSERSIGPYAGNNTLTPVYLTATSNYGVINYFDDTNTNIYTGLPSNDVKSWTEYGVFNNPDQSEDLTNIVAQIVFQRQVIAPDYILSVLSIRFQTNYQYEPSNFSSWNNYYIYFDITDGKLKFTTTQPSTGSAGSIPYKIVIIKNIMFILDETYTVTATYSSNGSCHAVSLNRLLGNPLSEIVPTEVKSSNILDYLQNVGTDDITSTWGCYDMSGNILELVDIEETDTVGLRGGHGDTDYQVFTPPISEDGSFYVSSSVRYEVNKFSYLGDSYMGFRIASSNNDLNLPDFVNVTNINNSANSDGYGAVAQNYSISKYLVTNAEYVEFLNSQAEYQELLWSSNMSINNTEGVYSVVSGMGNMPVNYMNWSTAAKYCNWLHDGKPNSFTTPNLTTAYTGLYLERNPLAKYYIPTENEWYKAAYYDPNKGGAGVSGYWNYATMSDDPPDAIIKTLECINDISFVELNNGNIKTFIATEKGLFSNEYSNFDVRSLLDTIQNTFFCDSLDFNKGSWTQNFNNQSNFVNTAGNIILASVSGSLWISYDVGQNFNMVLNNQGVKKAFISNKITFNDCRSQSCSECGDSNGGWDTTGGIFTWVPSSITTQSVCIPACGGAGTIPPYLMIYNGTPSMQNFYESRACNTCDSHFVGYVSPDNATGPGTNPKLNTVYSSGDIGKYYLTLTSGVYGGVSYNAGVYLMVDSDGNDNVGIVELPIYDPGDPSLTDAATNMCRPPCGEDCLWVTMGDSLGKSPTRNDGYDFYNCSYYSMGGSWVQAENYPGINELCIPPAFSASSVDEGYLLYPGILLYWIRSYNDDPDCCDCVAPTILPTTIGLQIFTPATKLPRLTGF